LLKKKKTKEGSQTRTEGKRKEPSRLRKEGRINWTRSVLTERGKKKKH